MVNELKRRYFNTEILLWIGLELVVLFFSLRGFMNKMTMLSLGRICALDILGGMSDNFVFPIIMIILTLCNQRMMKCDRNPMIIMRYNSKTGIYLSQAICSFIYAAILSFVNVVLAILSAWKRFGVLNNWGNVDSFMKVDLRVNFDIRPSSLYVIILYWLIMTLLLLITCMIGIVVESLFSSDIKSGLAIVIFAATDIFIPITYHRLLVFPTTWIRGWVCEIRLAIAFVIAALLVYVGYVVQRKREYYEYNKEY